MFDIGDRVFHCAHGVGVVRSIEEKSLLGGVVRFSVVGFDDLTVMVNQSRTDGALRSVVSFAESGDILGYLEQPVSVPPVEGPRAARYHLDRLKSGDIYQVCDVVRELTARSQVRKLTPRIGDILREARRLLVGELAMVREEEASAMTLTVDHHLSQVGEQKAALPAS